MQIKIIILLLAMMPVFVFGQHTKEEKISEVQFSFNYNSYQLNASDFVKLDSFLKTIEKKKISIVVSSGTDSDGDMNYNQKLSENRSKTLTDYLKKRGVADELVKVNNFGENNPLFSNSTAEGKRKNRFTKLEFFEKILVLDNVVRISASLRDDKNNLPIQDSMLLVFYKETPDTFYTDKNGNVEMFIPDTVKSIDFFVKDYFFSSLSVNKFANKDVKVDIQLKKAIVGNMAIFENIIFYGDQAVMFSSSHDVCDKIARFMKYNPHRSIEIAGHINGPDKPAVSIDSKEYKLSVQRAETVCNYLADKGISKDRFISKGYGNWEMLYPNAVSEEDQQKNRRVEVRIIK